MSYQVLARKWRPRSFDEMVGQEHVLKALINGLDNGRLHHAYLFTGTRGVGKTTLARIIAKCLNCEQGVSSTPCGECGACVAIAEGRFVDLMEVDAASRTKVEDTRDLLENVQYLPTSGRYKVYLIDEVHMLSTHSFNALLKTLEEPPPHVKFLLATTDPQKLPVTVLSRCLQFNLKNLGPERIVAHLKFVLGEEKIPFEEEALWALGRAADGSMRDALSLTDQAIAHGGGMVTRAEVNAMLGTIDRTGVVEICDAVASANAQVALAAVQKLADHAPDYNDALAEMLSFWHRVAIAQTAPDALDHSHADHQQVLQLAASLDRETVQLFYQITLLGRRDLPHAADPRSGFEMVLLRLLAFHPVMPDAALDQPMPSSPIPAQESSPAKKPDAAPQPAGPAAVAGASAEVTPGQSDIPPRSSSLRLATENGAAVAPDTATTPAAPGTDVMPSPPPVNEGGRGDRTRAKPSVGNAAVNVVAPLATIQPKAPVQGEQRPSTMTAGGTAPVRKAPLHAAEPEPAAQGVADYPDDNDRPPWEEYEATAKPTPAADTGEKAVDTVTAAGSRQQRVEDPLSVRPWAGTPSPGHEPEGLAAGISPVDANDPEGNLLPPASGERRIEVQLAALDTGTWFDVYLGLEVGGLLQSIAANLYLDSVSGDVLRFTLDHGQSSLYREEHQGRLAELLSRYFGAQLQVAIHVGDVAGETPRQILLRRRAERLQQAVDSLRQDPVVKALLAKTSGELLEHSVRPLD